tara:strand:+ start:1311 stop:1685 length:375 start_codon:yes stop_codon:yes gene_type:complete
MLKINSQKIALILVVLMTVACSDPKDKYIALGCSSGIEYISISKEIIMNENSRTFSTYLEISGSMQEITGVYSNDGDHHYLFTYDDGSQFNIDRRTLETNYDWQCEIIDLPDYILADKENKNKI